MIFLLGIDIDQGGFEVDGFLIFRMNNQEGCGFLKFSIKKVVYHLINPLTPPLLQNNIQNQSNSTKKKSRETSKKS